MMPDIPVSLDTALTAAWPLRLGLLIGNGVAVRSSPPSLCAHLDRTAACAAASVGSLDGMDAQEPLRDARQAYRAFGANPKRHPPSAEALVERLLRGKGMYKINNVVDTNNVVSLGTLCPVGSYDLDKLRGPVTMRLGKPGETYQAMSGQPFSSTNYPVFADREGIFGGVSRDSARAAITEATTHILMIVIAFSAATRLEIAINEAAELLVHDAEAKETLTWLV